MLEKIKGISTKPHYESYTWGDRSSLISRLTYFSIYFLRFFSLLQIGKLLLRAFKKWRLKDKSGDKLDQKARLDVHALFTELYLIGVLLLSLTLLYFRSSSFISQHTVLFSVLAAYFFLESVLWVIYYMLFRIIIERNLSIYNEAEYLITLPVAIVSQAILFCVIFTKIDPIDYLLLLFNISQPDLGLPKWVVLLVSGTGVTYLAAIVTSLIKIVPSIPVWKRPNITIIGSGQVVTERILPTLLKLYTPRQIAVASDYIKSDYRSELNRSGVKYYSVFKDKEKESQNLDFYSHEERERIRAEIVRFIVNRSSYAIIATPSDEHFPYIISLASNHIRFAVEKPICVAKEHLKVLFREDHLMKEGFLFSYYWLEKALPLNYFITLNPVYREFLKIKTLNETIDSPSSFAYVKRRLGEVKLVVIEFLEKGESEERYWTEIPESGGMITETILHALSLLRNTVGSSEPFTINESLWIRNEERRDKILRDKGRLIGPTYADLFLESGSCKARVRVGKYIDRKKRVMEIIYENGKILCDFDRQTCSVYLDNVSRIEIESLYKGSYETQLLLFNQFMQNGWMGTRFDDFPDQLRTVYECLEIYPEDAEIINAKRSVLNNWLSDNWLFKSGSITVDFENPLKHFVFPK